MENDLTLLYDLVFICLKRLDTEKDPKWIEMYTKTLKWTTKKLQARKRQIPFSLSPVENGTNTSTTNDICSRVGE